MNYRLFSMCILCLSAVISANAEDVVHERIEWSDVWIVDADSTSKTRVLLVGDSIVRGYYSGVEKGLGDSVSCARYTTSKFLLHPDYLTELGVLVKRFHFDVIHLNNGLHGWGHSEEQYREGLEKLLAFLKETTPDSKLIWAMTTPVREGNNIEVVNEERSNRVIARNRIASEILEKQGIPVNDLYSLVADHTDFYSKDGTHFSEAGRDAEAAQVVAAVQDVLK